jgi:hypothetical protein
MAEGKPTCEHAKFHAQVNVTRLTDGDGGRVTGYTSEITIKCADCGLPFRFLGLPFGSHYAEPRLSVDSLTLRAPLEPAIVTEILGYPLVSGNA